MEEETKIRQVYKQKRRLLEEQEDTIINMQKKARQLSEATYMDIRHTLHSFEQIEEPLHLAQQELNGVEEDFIDKLDKQRRKIQGQLEDIEYNYRKDLQQFDNGE